MQAMECAPLIGDARTNVWHAKLLGACLSIPREPRWLCKGADARRATPQTPLAEPTLRERTDLASFIVVASSLGAYPTSSAPPRLKPNPSRSRPRGILRQVPGPSP